MAEAKESKVEVSKIGLTIGQRRIELTVEEGRRLWKALSELYEKTDPGVQVIYYPRVFNVPVQPTYPYWWTKITSSGSGDNNSLEWRHP